MKIPFLGGASETPAQIDPALVAPMSTPARPELTGGRRILETPLEPDQMVLAFRRWDEEVGGAKRKG